MFNILCLYFVSTPKCLFTREGLCHLETGHNDCQNDYISVDLILLLTEPLRETLSQTGECEFPIIQ